MPKIIATFPAAGKTYIADRYPNTLDLESIEYNWLFEDEEHIESLKGVGTRKLNPDWPDNYVRKIKEKLSNPNVDIIFITSTRAVLERLHDMKIKYVLCIPSVTDKKEYANRCASRGNSRGFVDFVFHRFKDMHKRLNSDEWGQKIHMIKGEYLENTLERAGFLTKEPTNFK